jgi:hypothetical protein
MIVKKENLFLFICVLLICDFNIILDFIYLLCLVLYLFLNKIMISLNINMMKLIMELSLPTINKILIYYAIIVNCIFFHCNIILC